VNDRSTVDAIDGVQDSLWQFLRRGHADVAKHGSRELGEEPLDGVEPGAVFGCEYEGEAPLGPLGEPSFGFLRWRRETIESISLGAYPLQLDGVNEGRDDRWRVAAARGIPRFDRVVY
jgi:hypothetical protein